MSLQAVIDVARAYLGVTEDPPGSNKTVFGAEYGLDGQPWCVMFLWYVFQHAGERMAFFGGGQTASCSILLRWYKEQGLTVPVEQVQVGDIVLLNFRGGKDPEHCGLAVETEDIVSKDGTYDRYKRIMTIEGNTTPGEEGSQDNGGCVALKRRFLKNIVAVCRPQYQPEPEIVDDWSGHHAADAIRWGIDMGLIKGYPDGSIRPDEPVPLWRMLTILQRLADKIKEE